MTTSLYGIGLSGLGAARTALSTTGNNIANVNTPGYSRERTQLSQTVISSGVAGVTVSGIKRDYAQFVTSQLNVAQSKATGTSTHLDQVSQIDNLLGDADAGLSPLMSQFFAGVQSVAANPEDTAARASLLGSANSLAGQFRTFSSALGDMKNAADTQIASTVKQVNTTASQIADLNSQIGLARSRTGSDPNTLLDQRDQLVASLGQMINVSVSQTSDGGYNLSVAGQPLVGPGGAQTLTVTTAASDPSRQVLAFKQDDGNLRPIDDNQITGGTIGGLVAFKNSSLASAQLGLDRLAHDFSSAVNTVQSQGSDLNGNTGQALFAAGAPLSTTNASNTGSADLTVSFADGGTADVAASNYQVRYSQGQYQVTRLSDGQSVAAGGSPLSFGGLNVAVSGTPAEGDSFLVKPLNNAAAGFKVALSDPAAIAAATPGADGRSQSGDNRNALALANLQNASVVDGNHSLNADYAGLVGDVGNRTAALQITSNSQTALATELSSAQQSVSGVNLDEENVNLLYYQQMYQANAKVIQTASSLFDTLLGILN